MLIQPVVVTGSREQLVTAAAVEPVSLEEAKLHVRQDLDDDDDLILGLISAAREVCETYTKRTFVATVWDMYLDGFPWGGGYYNRMIRQMGESPFWLPTYQGIIQTLRTPVLSFDELVYTDLEGVETTIDPSLYRTSLGTPGRIQPKYGTVWPLTRPVVDAVRVRYTAGYSADASKVPAAVKAAMKLLIGHWYDNRESVVVGTIATELPFTVRTLLDTAYSGSYM